MTDTPDRRQLDVLPAQEASEAALRLLNADKTGQPFNFRDGDSPLFQIVVKDVRANLERLLVPQKADFDKALQSHNMELFMDLFNRLLSHFTGVKSHLSLAENQVGDLFEEKGPNFETIYEFIIDQKSYSTLKIGVRNRELVSLALIARIGLNEKYPGISDRYLMWRAEQGVERCSAQG